MYNFHYDYVLKAFNTKLLLTDTDSLCYEMISDNVYEQCFKDKELFNLVDMMKIVSIMIVQIKKYWER